MDYYPLRDFTYKLDYLFVPAQQIEDVFPARIQQLVWWSVCVLGLYGVILHVITVRWIAAALAYLFWIHPMHTEMLVWVSGRKDLIGLALGTVALLWGFRAWTNGSTKTASYYTGWTILSGLGKSTFGITPATLTFNPRLKFRNWSAPLLLLIIVLVLLALVQSRQYSEVTDMRAAYPLAYRLSASVSALGRALTGIFLPSANQIDIENWGEWLNFNRGYLPLGAAALIAAFIFSVHAIRTRRRHLARLFWVITAWTTYLPISGLIFPHRNFYSVRYFTPLFLVIFAASIQGIPGLQSKLEKKWGARSLLIAVGLITACTYFQIQNTWDSNLDKIKASVAHAPTSIALNTLLATEEKNLNRWGRLSLAEKENHARRLQWLHDRCHVDTVQLSCLGYWMNLDRDLARYSAIVSQLNPWHAGRAIAVYALTQAIDEKKPPPADALIKILAAYPGEIQPTPQIRWLKIIALSELASPAIAGAQYHNYLERGLLLKNDISAEAVYAKKNYPGL